MDISSVLNPKEFLHLAYAQQAARTNLYNLCTTKSKLGDMHCFEKTTYCYHLREATLSTQLSQKKTTP